MTDTLSWLNCCTDFNEIRLGDASIFKTGQRCLFTAITDNQATRAKVIYTVHV